MALPPISAGAFVLTNFPFGPPHRPDQPGPTPHIAYCLGYRDGVLPIQLMLAYTSSGMWRGGPRRLPHGVIEFDSEAASALNQSPFHLDLRCLARVPLLPAWFPRLGRSGHGIVAVASLELQARIKRLMTEIARRSPGNIEMRGIPDC